jgi:hypothetical protein
VSAACLVLQGEKERKEKRSFIFFFIIFLGYKTSRDRFSLSSLVVAAGFSL